MRFNTPKPFRRGDRLANLRDRMETMRQSTLQSAIIHGAGGDGDGILVDMVGGGTAISVPEPQPRIMLKQVIAVFWAMITGNSSVTNLFRYDWEEIGFSADGIAAITNGRSGSLAEGTYALNLYEAANTSTYQGGVDVGSANTEYPAGFSLKPVGGGGPETTHRVNVPVIMYEVINNEGSVKYWFNASTSHDGTCS